MEKSNSLQNAVIFFFEKSPFWPRFRSMGRFVGSRLLSMFSKRPPQPSTANELPKSATSDGSTPAIVVTAAPLVASGALMSPPPGTPTFHFDEDGVFAVDDLKEPHLVRKLLVCQQ